MQLKYKKLTIGVLLLFSVVIIGYTLITNKDHRDQASTPNQQAVNSNAPEPKEQIETNYYITIPKLNISAPIIQGVDPTDEKKYDEALKDGVAQMVGTPLPGTGKGNTFIYGHSSADDKGPYSQIFAGLDNLKFGDKIHLNLESKDYEYWVFEKKFVEKTDLSVLDQSGEERLTLMTCWPIGTDDRRLIIVAKRK